MAYFGQKDSSFVFLVTEKELEICIGMYDSARKHKVLKVQKVLTFLE